MNECLTTPQHENRSAIGCQNKVDASNGYQIKTFKILNNNHNNIITTIVIIIMVIIMILRKEGRKYFI